MKIKSLLRQFYPLSRRGKEIELKIPQLKQSSLEDREWSRVFTDLFSSTHVDLFVSL